MATDTSRFDPNFTQHVIDTIGPNATPRTRQVMGSLIKHVHDFAREVELTIDEWMMGVQFLNSVGQISDAKRNEGQRISDVIGLESLVDEIAHKLMTEADDIPTSSSILGPFWSPNAPFRENGDSIIMSPHNGQVTLMHGRVTDHVSRKPIAGAVFDIWQASSNGKYDFQDPENQADNNLRGKFKTDADGRYHFYCLRPTPYSLPTDGKPVPTCSVPDKKILLTHVAIAEGPAGVLFELLDRHPMRPAHIHLMVSQKDYKPVTTQIFPKDDPYLETDTVFAVKTDLVVDFKSLKGDNTASLELEYNVVLAPKDFAGNSNTPLATNGLSTNGVNH